MPDEDSIRSDNMWNRIMMIAGAVCVAIAFYLVTRLRRFSFVRSLAGNHPVLSWLLPVAAVAAAAVFFLLLYNMSAMVVVLLELMFAFLLTDLVFLFLPKGESRDLQCILGLILGVLILTIAFFNAHHVFRKQYDLTTDKTLPQGQLRIILIADAHLGVTLNAKNFQKQADRISAEEPDIVVIAGDYVDDDTSREDMIACCQALGTIGTRYGIYYVFGNHDRGYFNYRNFTSQELRENLQENGVMILEDQSVLLGAKQEDAAAAGKTFSVGGFYVTGRRDRSSQGRAAAETLTADLSENCYQVVLDHQPNDYAAEADAGMDLVLSGHTHGGHIFPAGLIGLWIKANDRVYGHEKRENTDFIVTSGISGWAIPFKTGCRSEYVVINVRQNGE